MKAIKAALFCLAAAGMVNAVGAADWPFWRGPNFNGSTSETNLPTTWSATENVAWKTELPGPSGSTPVVWGDTVFVSSPDAEKNLDLLCLSRKDGAVRWKKQVSMGDRNAGPRSNMSSPSPVTDGKRVIAMYGTGDVAAFDFEGKEIWKRSFAKEFGKFAIMWLYGSSPMIFDGRLYIQVLQTTPVPEGYTFAQDGNTNRESFLLCVDPATGKDFWKQTRTSEARMESKESYASPIPYEAKRRLFARLFGIHHTQILVLGGACVTGHDAKTGEELWRGGGLNPKDDPYWRIVPSPVALDGIVLASAPKRDPVFAFKTDGKGDVTESGLAWKFKENPTDWATPLAYKGRFYILDGDRHVLTCVQPKTGEKIWQTKLEVREPIWSSPTGADNKIYLISEAGTALVLDADEGKVLSTIKMEEAPVRSTIVAEHGELLIRTAQSLWCVRSK